MLTAGPGMIGQPPAQAMYGQQPGYAPGMVPPGGMPQQYGGYNM